MPTSQVRPHTPAAGPTARNASPVCSSVSLTACRQTGHLHPHTCACAHTMRLGGLGWQAAAACRWAPALARAAPVARCCQVCGALQGLRIVAASEPGRL